LGLILPLPPARLCCPPAPHCGGPVWGGTPGGTIAVGMWGGIPPDSGAIMGGIGAQPEPGRGASLGGIWGAARRV